MTGFTWQDLMDAATGADRKGQAHPFIYTSNAGAVDSLYRANPSEPATSYQGYFDQLQSGTVPGMVGQFTNPQTPAQIAAGYGAGIPPAAIDNNQTVGTQGLVIGGLALAAAFLFLRGR